MGGSGGGYSTTPPGELGKRIQSIAQEASQAADRGTFDTDVASVIGDALAELNSRDPEKIRKHLDVLKSALEKDIDGTIDLLFGGSVSKRTYAEGLSDVDALVCIDRSELANADPDTVCRYLEEKVKDRLSRSEVERDGFAIRVVFSDSTVVELVPIIRQGEKYLISNEKCTGWVEAHPRAFSEKLTQVNQACGSKVVPVIKLAKRVLAGSMPDKVSLSGYHIESLAVAAFDGYVGPLTAKAMLVHLFSQMPTAIRSPARDPTGQSRYLDGYLGAEGSLDRLMTADAVDRVGRRMRRAESMCSVDEWCQILST
jgi:hypothetical protein